MDNLNTTTPTGLRDLPHTPLVFLCPVCECELEYQGSGPAGTSNAPTELNDYFTCPAGCGTFEHERRTHRMRML